VRLPEPQFEGQTKEILGTPAVRAIVANVVAKELAERFSSSKRDDKAQTALLLDKVVSEMKARISARTHKETQRRKNALESSSLPAKLADCRTSDVEQSELFIVEGDSALGTAKLARNSEYQALLPIRGKILNVQKASISDMLSNAECAAIIQTIGAGSGRSFDLDAARYGKIILMSDADVDGAHIRTLLLTLFFRYMRPLIEAGRVYAAVPPLHRVSSWNPGSKPNETIYTYSSRSCTLSSRRCRRGTALAGAGAALQGLGEMDADQLARPRWTVPGDCCGAYAFRMPRRSRACSSCSWAAMSHRDATSSSPPATDSTVRPSTPEMRADRNRAGGIRSRAIAAAYGDIRMTSAPNGLFVPEITDVSRRAL
jgi:DNA gyrase subunit B